MKYNIIETDDIVKKYLSKHTDVDLNKYNDDYDFSINEKAINTFYNKLLEYKDSRFLIVGDYDCDGICSVTIIKNLFKKLGINNNYYIPSRTKEGYGLNKLIVDNAIKYNYDVLFLVDNGVNCFEAIEYAYANNIKVFIIDHHKYENMPKCEAFIHQDLLSKEFEYGSAGELCFLLSLCSYFDAYNLILAGLTILSDYIKINSFNRHILSKMLEHLNKHDYWPLFYLNESDSYSTTSLTFIVIPKINSISRMESEEINPNHIVKYLLSEYPNIEDVSRSISEINSKRKNESNVIFNDIISKEYDKDYIFINSKDINEGYCSSLATKLCSYYDKPVFVFNESDSLCKGSCRCQSLDIHSLLSNYSKYVSFGGHEHACGITLQAKDIDDFINYLDSLNFKEGIESEEYVYILDPSQINYDLLNKINSLGPFGHGYDMPLIGVKNNDFNLTVLKNKYTKFTISDTITAITFEEKYLGYHPKYIFGSLNVDSYRPGAFSIIIKGLF